MWHGIGNDLRYALRGLWRQPLFTLVAVLSLALGIGANAAIYSMFQQLLLQPLAVPQAQALVNLSSPGPKSGSTSNNQAGSRDSIFSYPMFRDLERLQRSLQGLAAHRSLAVNIGYQGSSRSGRGMLVSGRYFDLLGLLPAHGRLLTPGDDQPGGSRVVVLSHSYWQRTLAGAEVIGKLLRVNGEPLQIVGIAPAGFHGTTLGARAELFVPIGLRWVLQPELRMDAEDRQSYWVYLFGRLRPGIDRASAESELNRHYRQLIETVELPLHSGLDSAFVDAFRNQSLQLEDGQRGQSQLPRQAATPLAVLQAVAALVLLIACLNLANLLLARGSRRAGEFALRASIGGSRWRLLRQLLLEGVLLATLGGVLAWPLASLALQGLAPWLPAATAAELRLGLEPALLGSSLLLAAISVLLFALLPALQLAACAPIQSLRGDAGGSGGGRLAQRFRQTLAGGQMALSVAALALAGLFLHSLVNLSRVELGLETESIASFAISPQRNGYPPERSAALFEQLQSRLAALPGVVAVTTSLVPLLSHNEWSSSVAVEGFEQPADGDNSAYYNEVGSDFFTTFEVPLLAGRGFEPADRLGRPRVAVVNQRFAEKFGLGRDAVGKRMATQGGNPELDIEIVGVVADVGYSGVRAGAPEQFYLPRAQSREFGEAVFYVRTALAPESLLAELPALVAALDPELPVEQLQTLPQQIADNISVERFVGIMSAGFALLATALATLGLYGLLSYSLALRTREFGLRLAVGAAPGRLRALLLRQIAGLAAAGTLIGLGLALAIGRVAEGLLFGVSAWQPGVYAAAVLVLLLVTAAAGFGPAQRASRIDPMQALRHS